MCSVQPSNNIVYSDGPLLRECIKKYHLWTKGQLYCQYIPKSVLYVVVHLYVCNVCPYPRRPWEFMPDKCGMHVSMVTVYGVTFLSLCVYTVCTYASSCFQLCVKGHPVSGSTEA